MSQELHDKVYRFLVEEAELLDTGEYDRWLELLDPRIRYFMPVRSVRYGPGSSEFSQTSFHFNESYFTLQKRVARLHTKHAWAEDPSTRYRHFVTNVAVAEEGDDRVAVKSNVLLYRGRGPTVGAEVLTGVRHDELCASQPGLRLLSRWFFTDQTVLPTSAITTFV